jgi:hypothetical protein
MNDDRSAPPLYAVRVGALRGAKHRFPGGVYETRGFDLALRAAIRRAEAPAVVVEVVDRREFVVFKNDCWKARERRDKQNKESR